MVQLVVIWRVEVFGVKKDKIVIIASCDERLNLLVLKEQFLNIKIILDNGNINPDEVDAESVFIVESGQNKNDASLIEKWVGHNHIRYIKKEKTPESTFCSLTEEITFFAESEYEIEKKFLIKYPDICFLKNLYNCKEVEIEQIYLNGKDEISRRIRKRSADGKTLYFYTQKKQISKAVREEKETLITPEEYEKLKFEKSTECEVITKKRFCLMENGCYFEIDVFPFMKKYAVLEIELKNENDDFELPDFIKIIEDVTEKREFTNYNMSKKLKTDPEFYYAL